jgi:hypothetical protein
VAKAKKADDDVSVLEWVVNGHTLAGEKRGGRWTFTCPDWPDLARRYAGVADVSGVLNEFMAKALAGAVAVGRLAGKGG